MLGLDYGGNYHKPQYLQTQWPWSAISRVDFATRNKYRIRWTGIGFVQTYKKRIKLTRLGQNKP